MRNRLKVGLLQMAMGIFLVTPSVAQEHGHMQHSQSQHESSGIQSTGPEAHPFVYEMTRDMEKMMVDMHAPGYSGNWDIDFLAMMIPHHQGAIDMARLVLIYGEDPPTRRMAQEIIASQQSEIEAMKARLAILKGRDGTEGTDAYPALSGTRGLGVSGDTKEQ